MIKHVVLFSVKDNIDGLSRDENIQKVKVLLEELPGLIDCITDFEVGINMKESARAADIAIVSSFALMEDLSRYSVHPEHLRVLEYIRNVWDNVRAADYEV